MEITEKIDLYLTEKWPGRVEVKHTGEHAGKSIAQLKKEIEALKGKKPFNREKFGELLFALRAKEGWPKGKGSTGLKKEADDLDLEIDLLEFEVLSGILLEKWPGKVTINPAEKGKYAGKSVAELKKRLAELKKTGPHPRGSKEFGEERELMFAIRAKTGWGKVGV